MEIALDPNLMIFQRREGMGTTLVIDSISNLKSYSNEILVQYDIQPDQFFWADPLLFPSTTKLKAPLPLVVDDTLHILGGETGGACVYGKPVGLRLVNCS